MAIKGKKFYAVTRPEAKWFSHDSENINDAKAGLDEERPYLVELTVTRVWTRSTDIQEVND